MKKVILMLILTVSIFGYAKASENNNYTINDQQLEQMFTNSTEINLNQISENLMTTQATSINLAENKMAHMKSEKSSVVAILLCFFVGGLGVHRAYLGTATMTWVGYILTCGGIFGIVPLVDFVVLIIDMNNVDKYVDNSKFFMW